MTNDDSRSATIALLGLDHPHAPLMLRSLQNMREVSRVLLWPENPAGLRAARTWDQRKVVAVERNLDQLLRDHGVDAAILCARTESTAAIALDVVRARVPLLSDKPAGMTAREVGKVATLARKHAVPVSVYYGQRLHPAARKIRDLIAAGDMGDILTAETRMHTTQV